MHKLFAGIFDRKNEGDEKDVGGGKDRHSRTYGWFKVIEDISTQLRENVDKTSERNVIEFLSWLQYFIMKSEVREEQQELERLKNGR